MATDPRRPTPGSSKKNVLGVYGGKGGFEVLTPRTEKLSRSTTVPLLEIALVSLLNYDKDCTVFTAIQVDWFHVFGLSDTYRRVLEACLLGTVCAVMTATYGGPGGARQLFSRFWGPTRKTIWSETPFNV